MALTSWRLVPSTLGLGSMGNVCYSKNKLSSTGVKWIRKYNLGQTITIWQEWGIKKACQGINVMYYVRWIQSQLSQHHRLDNTSGINEFFFSSVIEWLITLCRWVHIVTKAGGGGGNYVRDCVSRREVTHDAQAWRRNHQLLQQLRQGD